VNQVRAADDADQVPVIQHRNALDAPPLKQRGDCRQRRVGRHSGHIARHDVARVSRVRLDVLRRRAVGAEEAHPPGVPAQGAVGADLVAVQEVGLADDPHEPLAVDHRQRADAALEQQARDLAHQRSGRHRDHLRGHDVFGVHRNLLVARCCARANPK
jgi:hypothetical protein